MTNYERTIKMHERRQSVAMAQTKALLAQMVIINRRIRRRLKRMDRRGKLGS